MIFEEGRLILGDGPATHYANGTPYNDAGEVVVSGMVTEPEPPPGPIFQDSFTTGTTISELAGWTPTGGSGAWEANQGRFGVTAGVGYGENTGTAWGGAKGNIWWNIAYNILPATALPANWRMTAYFRTSGSLAGNSFGFHLFSDAGTTANGIHALMYPNNGTVMIREMPTGSWGGILDQSSGMSIVTNMWFKMVLEVVGDTITLIQYNTSDVEQTRVTATKPAGYTGTGFGIVAPDVQYAIDELIVEAI